MYKNPILIDNLNGNTLAQALADALSNPAVSDLETQSSDKLRIATAFFSPAGFKHIADHLTNIADVRLLLGTDPSGLPIPDPKRIEETHHEHEHRRMDAAWKNQIKNLSHDRDQLPFTRTSRTALETLTHALRAGNLQVRRYTNAFLHAKTYIYTSDHHKGIIAGSANLTHAGLTQNLELNLGCFDQDIVQESTQWFDDLWDEAEPFDLAEIYQVLFATPSPWIIFLRVLLQLYGKELEEEQLDDKTLPLTSFQEHGVARARRLIKERGGVIVADEVGLGKTFIAGEILRIYSDRRQCALLICPASLRDTTWKKFLTRYGYSRFIEYISFEQLASDCQLQDKQRPNANSEHLQRSLEEYQLIIVDEAHNYRNPNTPSRAAALRRLLFGQKRDLLLLTATPVNNSLWDLYYLIQFFVRQDAHLADRGILSIRQRFIEAMKTNPTDLSPDILYPIIDATTVKRTRQFINKHYSTDTIKATDGTPRNIVFPKPKAITVRYALEDQLPGFFDQLEEALDSGNHQCILFSRYMPDAYRMVMTDNYDNARVHAMTGLLRSGLLKRFESSGYAFQVTLEKMISQHKRFLEFLDQGIVVTTDFLNDLEISGDDNSVYEELFKKHSEDNADARDFDVTRLKNDVIRDLNILQKLKNSAASITKTEDAKLRALSDELSTIASDAEAQASDNIDEHQKRKVLIFSSFADTVSWIREFLLQEVQKRKELMKYNGRIAAVSGSQRFDGVSKNDAILGFAPVSMQAGPGKDTDKYDILITTDVLAEGVNLQQCRHIINYDVPWNPMRLVQRHGRIDRIDSPHNRVFLRTIFPTDRLDDLLDLESRILEKLAMAAASVGVRAPVEEAAHGHQVFADTTEEIQKLRQEDPSLFERGGTVAASQTGEEYRQTLRKFLRDFPDKLSSLPWKVGSGMKKGQDRGIFFCSVIGENSHFQRTYLRFVKATPEWIPQYDSEPIIDELGTCLRMIECEENTPTWCPDQIHENVFDFWEIAQKHILDDWTKQTDPANLQPKLDKVNREVASFIRQYPPKLTSEQIIKALDIVESPWPRREQNELRHIYKSNDEKNLTENLHDLSSKLVQYILHTGLEASQPPDPLPPIEIDDIKLLCWMAIECEKGQTASSNDHGSINRTSSP